MKRTFGIFAYILLFVFQFSVSVSAVNEYNSSASSQQISFTNEKINKIESWVKKNMKQGKIPGVSVVIVNGDKTVYNNGFGYADKDAKKPITPDTLFELGSTSKAFTALGILKLEKEGKINLNDPITKYIPWLKMKYVGQHGGNKINGYVDINLNQLLHHTSGIPFKSIGDIPVADGDDALEKTVRTQVDKELDFYPGEKYLYATINYDILGLVIQNVSGKQYEQYMKKNILEPLGLNNTYLFRNEVPIGDMSAGYKAKFLIPARYDAPLYRGNTPAGYFITNSEDMAKWIKIQLGTQKLENFDYSLIKSSHQPDRSVAPSNDGSSYASGWSVFQDGGGMIAHGGSNPNFSSYIIFRPQDNIGVAVLANLDSSYTPAIANGINEIIKGEKPKGNSLDTYISIDNVSFTIVAIAIAVSLVTVYMLLALIMQIIKKERKYIGSTKKVITYLFSSIFFLAGFGYCLYRIPNVLYWGLPWSFIKVWAPESFIIAVISLFATVVIFCAYFTLASVYQKPNDKSFFIIATLSVISGFGNALIIFIINETLNRGDEFQSGLLLFFILGIIIYVYGQRLVRTKLLTITNDLVYTKRIQLINKILKTPYEKIEQMENGKIHAGLNNDTETISNFANIIITAVTSVVTLICCFVYLGIINFYGLLVSILVIFIAAGSYFLIGRYANRLWEETRDIQNVFFGFINSLINGFKELKMNNRRQSEFKSDIESSCDEYRYKRIKGDLGFANVFIIGELLFTIVIGVVAFAFPSLFEDIETSTLRNYVFVFLYMTGPVHGVLNSIPEIFKIRIGYKRINDLIKELEVTQIVKESAKESNSRQSQIDLKLSNVEYSYKNSKGEIFKVGPIDCSFKSGQISFITGGNGSGKSTLAKLISGLYRPDDGEITLNNNRINNEDLCQNYSAIFSDYYLFDKLYGVDHSTKKDKIAELLKILRIEDKINIDNGVFSTTKLSSGQRKRLALLVSYLEEREIYLFDEWAADQDPEFRKYFYECLLMDLKKRGKCIIAITHDDKYFNIADNVIKMDMGKIVS